VSGPSTLSIFFTLEMKGLGEGGLSRTEGGKAAADLENLLMVIFLLIWLNRCVIKVLYVEKTTEIYGCHQF
jgi:hypothetical protein